MSDPVTLAALNAMDQPGFAATLGALYEHSPWVAEAVWSKRPFPSIDALHRAMADAVHGAGREAQMALIRAHPELGAAAVTTDFSKREQASAGLSASHFAEAAKLRALNRSYRDKFGFPFIMAVKGRTRAEIVAAAEERLGNPPENEQRRALDEIVNIARFRLDAVLPEGAQPLEDFVTGVGQRLVQWADQLAAITEEKGTVTRTFLTPQHRAAAELVMQWMRAAGMQASMDAVGNAVGRYDAARANAPALLIGSHLDTVRNAGRYDGILGVLTPIACVAALSARGERLPFAIEVIGFADEEGVRFQSTLLGSRAVAGTFERTVLDRKDEAGITMREAMLAFGLDPARIGTAARRRDAVLGYIELHIEQGPVLEAENLPVGIVTSIAGVTRATFEVVGEAGHAGTVPMKLRHDAMAAAAEIMIAIENRARENPALVATVGQITAQPGAVNVIPGRVKFSLDLRSPDDATRLAAYADIVALAHAIGRRRGVGIGLDRSFESAAVACSAWLMVELERAVATMALPRRRLPSGAGHDAMAMAALTDIGMIFVRCKGGISHNPAESITADDAETGARVLMEFLRRFQPRESRMR
jgi:beta-ureidopropionase / N-carbamoyl-L-amino-acid hydrolase